MEEMRNVAFEFCGRPNAAGGWTFLPSEEGKMVYVPFEGTYASKGGRIRSPRFSLNKAVGKAAFFLLAFTAKASVQGYWWVDFYDKDGYMLPDINSALYASETEMPYDVVLFADPRAVFAEISFVTKEGVTVRDIRMKQIAPADAAEWCDRLYATLPQRPFAVPTDAFAFLPKTKAALNNGTPWRILMLGDSIVNDTWCSNFQSLVMRDFPQSQLEFMVSVRGSTGVWFYKEPMNFQEYVGQFKPDLVMIGGCSNEEEGEAPRNSEENLISVIQQCRAIGAEVIVMSPALSYKWRNGSEPAAFDENFVNGKKRRPYRRDYQFAATQKTKTAYWDLTTVPCQILAECPQPSSWFSRDVVHSNDRGKQLIGQNLAAWFRAAKEG